MKTDDFATFLYGPLVDTTIAQTFSGHAFGRSPMNLFMREKLAEEIKHLRRVADELEEVLKAAKAEDEKT